MGFLGSGLPEVVAGCVAGGALLFAPGRGQSADASWPGLRTKTTKGKKC